MCFCFFYTFFYWSSKITLIHCMYTNRKICSFNHQIQLASFFLSLYNNSLWLSQHSLVIFYLFSYIQTSLLLTSKESSYIVQYADLHPYVYMQVLNDTSVVERTQKSSKCYWIKKNIELFRIHPLSLLYTVNS